MINILFNGHDFKFLNYLIEYCEQSENYQVTMDFIPGHEMSHIEKSLPLLEQADLIFCEWALGNAEWYSINKHPDQKLVIRLHHQEINLNFLSRINWSNVDQIVFICPGNMEIFLHRFPFMASRTSLIYNVIDCSGLDRPKLPGARFNLGFIGTSPMRKSPHLAVEIFEKLKRIDDRFTLYFKGKHPWEYPWLWKRVEERTYYESLYDRINNSEFASSMVFDPHGNDMHDWFSKIGFILSTSEHEGSHQAVAEGMAAGSIPIIRNWAGAGKLYPAEFVVRSVDESVDLIISYKDHLRYIPKIEEIRKFSEENFDIPVIIARYEHLFRNLLGEDRFRVSQEPQSSESETGPAVKAMHVCYLNVGSQSGYEVRVVEETKALVRQGIEIYIVVFLARKWFSQPDELNAYQKRLEDMTRANIIFFPTDHFFDLAVSDAMIREIDEPLIQLASVNDIRIFHGQALYSAMHALRAAKVTGAKVVFDNHGASPEETEMTGGTPGRVTSTTEFEKHILKEADLRIMVSDRMNSFYIEKYNLPELPYQLVPCCVRSNEFKIAAEERNRLRNKKGFTNKFVILYLGTLSVWQWPEAMFNLFSRLCQENRNCVFYLLVPAYDHAKAKEFINKYNLPPESFLLEEVAHSEIGKTIGIADAGLLLRKPHPVNLVSSPTKFGEYLASGVPVILTEGIGDYSEMAEKLNVGIQVKADEDTLQRTDFARLINFIKDVEENREQWGSRCIKTAQTGLDWNIFGQNLANKYKALLTSD
jgi:glycosyltransferase involved in cell wall biosynthesis